MKKMMTGLLSLVVAAALTACGGGGGNAGTTGNGSGTTGGSGGTGGTPSTPTPTLSIAVSLVNASGQAVTSITAGGAFQVKATVTDQNGAAVSNRSVTFAVNNAAVAVLPQTTALTDASGNASVPINAASFVAAGAATVTASAQLTSGSGSTVSGQGSTDFAVAAAGLALSPLTIGNTSLDAAGNTQVSVTALVNNAPLTGTPVNVAFSASCGRINGNDASGGGVGATTNGSGVASVNYTSVNADGSLCSGNVVLSASSTGATTRTASVNVAAPVANAIAFVNAAPAQVFIAGSGGVEQSAVTFKVFGASNTPLPGVSVTFSIQQNPGGVGINASGSTANVTGTTDQSGQVSVSVFSGTIPGPVKLRASLASTPSVFAETQNLTVASGPPSQRFMSLSVSTFNIEAANVDGTPTTLTVRIADRQGNAVADGTVVNFTTEGGQVANSCATATVNKISSCSVDFRSQNPRPSDGRVSVMAYLAGTKDYDDLNGNNVYDPGIDNLKQMGDAYRDDNENNTYDNGEFFVSGGGSLTCAGTGGAFASRANTCTANLAATVRQTAVLLFAASQPADPTKDASFKVSRDNTGAPVGISFKLGSSSNPSQQLSLVPMPAGTTIAATPVSSGCQVTDVLGSPVISTISTPGTPTEDLRTNVAISLSGCAAGQVVNIKVTAPSGLVAAFPVGL